MFAGKSTELIKRLRRHQLAEKRCIVIKYTEDIRYSDSEVYTHDKQHIPAVKIGKNLL